MDRPSNSSTIVNSGSGRPRLLHPQRRQIPSRSSSIRNDANGGQATAIQTIPQGIRDVGQERVVQSSSLVDSKMFRGDASGTVSQRTPYRKSQRSSNGVYIPTTARRSSIVRNSMAHGILHAYLIYTTENNVEQRFDLTRDRYTIGRMEDRDIVLQCRQISKDHCEMIKRDDQGWFIVDHNSVNKVLVNSEIIEPSGLGTKLVEGDSIKLGTVLLQFHDEVHLNQENWRRSVNSHPAFASFGDEGDEVSSDQQSSSADDSSQRSDEPTSRILSIYGLNRNSRVSLLSRDSNSHNGTARPSSFSRNHNLVTILPSEKKYEDTLTVRAELKQESDSDFKPVSQITDVEMLKNDYEKLRLAFELSKLSLTDMNLDDLLEKTLDIVFSVLPVDRGVILLVDKKTSVLTINKVKVREGRGIEKKEILLSRTVLQKVVASKTCLITSDAFEDPLLGKSESIARCAIRSVLCVPLVSHDQVHGVLHLDSKSRINAFAEKDLSLIKAISNQAAIALENCQLIQDIEKEVVIRENLGRFLAPHVIDKVIQTGEEPFERGGRQCTGTILFADIRGFTAMSENESPQEVVDLLNDFFERLVKIVFKYDGVLDKYIGDCLMAAFGTLPGQIDPEINAVRAALEFKLAINEMNAERMKRQKPSISIGIGINTGNLVAGYIGSSQRLEYTSIGDTVNTAARIQGLAHSNQVLISEMTYRKVIDLVQAKYLSSEIFKGKSKEVAVYEVSQLNDTDDDDRVRSLRKLSE